MKDWAKTKEEHKYDSNGVLIPSRIADEHIKELELLLLRVADWDIPEGEDKKFLFELHKKYYRDTAGSKNEV